MGLGAYENLTENSIERKLIKVMAKLWTDFAKFGYAQIIISLYF